MKNNDISSMFKDMCEEAEDCLDMCEGECERKETNSIQDDGCFCRGRCKEFQPMAEPDGPDGKCLCYGCKHGF